MVREPGGKLIVTGYAGTNDANQLPSDAGVIRFNADLSLMQALEPTARVLPSSAWMCRWQPAAA